MQSYESSPVSASAIEHKPKWLPLGGILLLAIFGGIFLLMSVVQLLLLGLIGILRSETVVVFVIMGFLGVVMLAYLYLRLSNQKKIKGWLKLNGVRLNAEFVRLIRANARINRQIQYIVQVRWIDPATGKPHHFYSGYVNPKLFIEPLESKTHTVIANPANFDFYFVEINSRKISD
jgi:hypothetical protein